MVEGNGEQGVRADFPYCVGLFLLYSRGDVDCLGEVFSSESTSEEA